MLNRLYIITAGLITARPPRVNAAVSLKRGSQANGCITNKHVHQMAPSGVCNDDTIDVYTAPSAYRVNKVAVRLPPTYERMKNQARRRTS